MASAELYSFGHLVQWPGFQPINPDMARWRSPGRVVPGLTYTTRAMGGAKTRPLVMARAAKGRSWPMWNRHTPV